MATQLPLLPLPDARRTVSAASSAPSPRGPARGRSGEGGPVARRGSAPRGPVTTAADPASWRLDDHTREVGLRGVEEARRALAAAVKRVGVGTAA